MADLRAAIADGTLAACAQKVFQAYDRSADSADETK
jgi:hypothetical protein